MRKKDRQITDEKVLHDILTTSQAMRLALCDQGQPYIVSLNYGFGKNVLFFHCAHEGYKVDILEKNNKVCFQMDMGLELRTHETNACSFGMGYKSLVGFGTAVKLDDPSEKIQGLKAIMAHYSDREFEFEEKQLKATSVYRIDIESMTGKQAGL